MAGKVEYLQVQAMAEGTQHTGFDIEAIIILNS
jgi:hypothetical protein